MIKYQSNNKCVFEKRVIIINTFTGVDKTFLIIDRIARRNDSAFLICNCATK